MVINSNREMNIDIHENILSTIQHGSFYYIAAIPSAVVAGVWKVLPNILTVLTLEST